jgi:non-heme chloroperoxidase
MPAGKPGAHREITGSTRDCRQARAVPPPDGVAREVLETGRQNLIRDPHHQIATAAADFFAATLKKVPAEAMEWWTRMIVDRVPLKVMIDLHKLMTETDFRPQVRTIASPTLILHGDRDVSTIWRRPAAARSS